MKVGWLADDPGYVGGAERTMAEFRAVAPEGVEVVDGDTDADIVVVGNHHAPLELTDGQDVVRYHHDMTLYPVKADRRIFCSPMQRAKYDPHNALGSSCVPPALDLEHLRQVRQAQDLMGEERKGAVWLGMHPNHPGKGLDLALECVKGNGGLDVYGNGSANGLVPAEDVARLLARYKVFVHLPRAIEPFGRSVVEAWAAGCTLVLNNNVGARHYIENEPEKLESAGEDFWRVVLSG